LRGGDNSAMHNDYVPKYIYSVSDHKRRTADLQDSIRMSHWGVS
jgi:hypothetical protein